MPKIAIFMNSLAGGGMERAMLNLASFFVAQGASVDLLVASSKGPLLAEVPDSVNLIDLSKSKSDYQSVRWWFLRALSIEPLFIVLCFVRKLPKAVKVIPGLIAYLNNSSPDSVLSTPTTANLALIWAKVFNGYDKRIVIREATTLSSEIKNNNSVFFRLAKRFVRKWYEHADSVVCVSDGVKDDLENNFSLQEGKLQTIYNIINVESIKKKSASLDSESLIKKYGKFVLSIGRLDKQKDFETLIRAYHLISNDIAENLVILGEGAERSNLEYLINKLSLTNRVFLPGFFLNPYPFINNCDVFALSSRIEGCPNVLREALILQKKIISTDCAQGVREILINGWNDQLIPVGNHELYARNLKKILQSDVYYIEYDVESINQASKDAYKCLFMIRF